MPPTSGEPSRTKREISLCCGFSQPSGWDCQHLLPTCHGEAHPHRVLLAAPTFPLDRTHEPGDGSFGGVSVGKQGESRCLVIGGILQMFFSIHESKLNYVVPRVLSLDSTWLSECFTVIIGGKD